MMNIKWYSILFLAVLLSINACDIADDDGLFNCEEGEGEVETFELEMNDFKGVDLKIAADVYITQGNEQKVLVEGQQNIVDLLELDIQDKVWDIELDECIRDYEELRIFITLPEIDYLAISGSGDLYGENIFEVNDIDLRISGSGDMKATVDAKYVDARISGSGNMRLKGITEEFDFRISGSGDFKAFELESLVGDIRISGSGDAEVWVQDELDIKISGSGDVYYRGYPILNVNITGSGDVRDAN